ncbi:MAG: glycoside hydrolase family 6 protein, partial [Actinomycetota bacterium]|nr:glycoside hydrolase family 6 protein [Actinomycetota bacterium]
MAAVRRFALLALVAVTSGVMAAGANAASLDPGGFRLESTHLYVHENAGVARITVERTNTHDDAQIRYIALSIGHPCGDAQCTALPSYDYTSGKGMLDFPAGVATATFDVPVVDHGWSGFDKTIQVSLFGPSPIGMASPATATLTILNDDPVVPRDPANPLDLPTPPPAGDPLTGAHFYVDHASAVSTFAHRFHALGIIAREPGTARFGKFSGSDVGWFVNHFLTLASATEPGTVPMLATYRVVAGHCSHWADPPGDQLAYHNFIARFAQGVGSYRAVLFLEMDSLITTPCLSRQGVAVRMAELRDAINVLTAGCPHLVIYLDAGAADALPARQAARLLVRAGVSQIQGFFLNATHFDWTAREIRYGQAISRMTGGTHFVVNTGENGRGPLRPPDPVHQGNEVLCNPPGRGLGPLPTTATGIANVDAFAWTSNPGESG